MEVPDLTHANWVLFTQQKLISNINNDIPSEVIKNGNKMYLKISNISEKDLDKLYFITNTDNNNNYLYIENFNVYIGNSLLPENIPGLLDVVISSFRSNDANAFINGSKVYYPFDVNNFQGSYFKGKTFSEFVDTLSGLLPFSATTTGYNKKYEIIMNPDFKNKNSITNDKSKTTDQSNTTSSPLPNSTSNTLPNSTSNTLPNQNYKK